MANKKGSAKYFDYGTGSAPKFKRAKKKKARKSTAKSRAKKSAATRKRKKFNKDFYYGLRASYDKFHKQLGVPKRKWTYLFTALFPKL